MATGVAGLAAAGLIDTHVAGYLSILFLLCPLTVVTTNALSERVVAGETRAIGVAVLAGLITLAALAWAGVDLDLGPRWFMAAYIVSKFVEALVIVSGRWWVTSVTATAVGSTALALWAFGAQMILGILYSRLAVFTVERTTTRAELGVFSVATALQGALLLVPVSLALLHFPELTRREQANDASGVRRILVRSTILSGAGVTFGVGVLALLISPIGALLESAAAIRAVCRRLCRACLVEHLQTRCRDSSCRHEDTSRWLPGCRL